MSISYFIRSMIIINFRPVKSAVLLRGKGIFFVVFLDIYKRVHIRVSIFRTTQYQSCGYWVYKHSRSMKRNIFHSKCVLINHMVEMYRNRTPSESTKCWLQTLNYKLNSNQPTYIFHIVTVLWQSTAHNSICYLIYLL